MAKKRSFVGARVRSLTLIVVITLVLLETTMRLLAAGILAEQELANEIHESDKEGVRIVTLGESTTADTSGLESWPRLLEKTLRAHGSRARVYNLARTGTTSTDILERLPDQLDKFQPDIVVSMMGVNDDSSITYSTSSWWETLRVFKLYRWIRIGIQKSAPEMTSKNFSDPETTEKIFSFLKSKKYSQAFSLVEKSAEKLVPDEKAQHFQFWGWTYFYSSDASIRDDSPNLFLRSFSAKIYGGWVLAQTARDLAFHGRVEECFDLAEAYENRGWFAPDYLVGAFSSCALLAAGLGKPISEQWRSMLTSLSGGKSVDEMVRNMERTKRNYRALVDLLSERGIRLVVVQYPTLSVDLVKKFFDSNESNFKDLVFVENAKNFAEALKTQDERAIFRDKFAGSFGHTTDLGNQLIADSVFTAVSQLVVNRSRPPPPPEPWFWEKWGRKIPGPAALN